MRWLLLANAGALAAAVAWLGSLALPTARAIRVRNAFLLRRGMAEDFAWTPAQVPAGFRIERGAPPDVIVEAVEAAGITSIDGDWKRALALVTLLLRHAREDAPIRADLATTWREIAAGTGYCSDYVRAYIAAATAAGVFCRQWAFSFDGFGGHGHTFVEVYDREHAHWSFLDVHNNVYAVRSGGNAPLAAVEVRAALLADPESLEFRRAGEGRLGYLHAHKLLDYYCRGAGEWYLWFGNDVATRERQGVAAIVRHFSGPTAHRLASALGILPPIVALADARNEAAIARMEALRSRVWLAAGLIGVLLVGFLAQMVAHHG